MIAHAPRRRGLRKSGLTLLGKWGLTLFIAG